MRRGFSLAAISAICLGLAFPLAASSQENLPQESLQIGLSTDKIVIEPNFSGAGLTIFGALDSPDPLILRQGRYDLVVVLSGPEILQTVRRKSRVLGMWVNTKSASFNQAPESYITVSTRNLQDITSAENFSKMALGVRALKLDANIDKTNVAAEFADALKQIHATSGTYSENAGQVEFISKNLFRATLDLPANIPVGRHKARAFLFRNGEFIRESSGELEIVKSGIEQWIYETAHKQSAAYGLAAILIAVAIGGLGNAVFRKG